MKFSPDAFEETVEDARVYLSGPEVLSRGFAEAIVKLADCCVVGVRCARHYGAVHGQEAEELRAGVEQILRNTADVRDDEASFVLVELRKALNFLLDRVDARDSLSFREDIPNTRLLLEAYVEKHGGRIVP